MALTGDRPASVLAAAEALQARLAEVPAVALVLGSGLGALADEVEDVVRVPATEVPGLPVPRVPGHSGALVAGYLLCLGCLAMRRRMLQS